MAGEQEMIKSSKNYVNVVIFLSNTFSELICSTFCALMRFSTTEFEHMFHIQ